MLAIEKVGKRYEAAWVARGVSFTVAPGSFTVLLGSSGAGKSTILRIVSGAETPDEGRIIYGGVDLTDQPPEKRPVATVWQSLNLFPHMSVVENASFGLRVKGVSRRSAFAKADELLGLVGLGALRDRRAVSLSGGEQQRVALVRSLIVEPAVLLLDEPLGAIDPQMRHDMVQLLRGIHREREQTFLMVTHRLEEALACATDLALMYSGQVHAVGNPREAFEAPATIPIAAMLGWKNVFPASSPTIEGGVCSVVTSLGRLSATNFAPVLAGCTPFYSVRPCRIRLCDAPLETQRQANCVSGRISDILFEGEVLRVLLRVGESVLEVETSATDAASPGLRVGQAICGVWDPPSGFCRTGLN